MVSEGQRFNIPIIITSKSFVPSLSSPSLVNIICLMMLTNLVGGSIAGSESIGKGYLSIYLSINVRQPLITTLGFLKLHTPPSTWERKGFGACIVTMEGDPYGCMHLSLGGRPRLCAYFYSRRRCVGIGFLYIKAFLKYFFFLFPF